MRMHCLLLVHARRGLDTGTRHFGKVELHTCTRSADSNLTRVQVFPSPKKRVPVLVRYGLYTLPNTLVWFETSSIQVPGTSVSRYELDTGTRHFGTFGTNSIPVPDTLGLSVQPRYWYPKLR